ncbi:curved DNA-binding protein [Lewinella marina]|uniref:Molecular chaperone DnaJ n=1 Tax=Neolewinella marina TaxID=438751 RepID=A0A2G0CJV5_9BACT|nr:J domain-containing protein [Neolewinella marina]NJB84564.1 curved DNA-binding protein [Neolewinella marina]PHL00254.1 molecular chaperone DnaJ [Neolewinella marina]
MAQFIDYYQTLGVDKSADEKQLKKAYRKLARKYHPDIAPDDAQAEQRFKAVNEAYAVLSDPEKRAKYDKYGKDWEHAEAFEQARQQRGSAGGGGGAGFGGFGGDPFGGQYTYTTGGDGADFSDFFRDMFGGGAGAGFGGQRRAFRGRDIEAELRVQMSDILQDNKQVLTVNGKQLRVTIPAGVEEGQTLRLRGQGSPGAGGGPAGDLYITFRVDVPADYRREGADLYKTVEVDLYTMLLGGKITVDTPTGAVSVPVSATTANNTRVRLKGKGLPRYKSSGHGDLYLDLVARLPTSLSADEKEAFTRLARR